MVRLATARDQEQKPDWKAASAWSSYAYRVCSVPSRVAKLFSRRRAGCQAHTGAWSGSQARKRRTYLFARMWLHVLC